MKTLRESYLRMDGTGRPQSESATDSGPVRVHTEVTRLGSNLESFASKISANMGLGCDKFSEKILKVSASATASAQSNRSARSQLPGGSSQRRPPAQEHPQSARGRMAGSGHSSVGSRHCARGGCAEVRAAMPRGRRRRNLKFVREPARDG